MTSRLKRILGFCIVIAIGWHTQCYASVNSTCPSLSNQHSYPLKAYRYPQKNTAERMLLIESGLPGLTIAVVDEFSNAFQLTSTFGLTKLEPSSNLDFSPSFICVYSNNVTKVEASLMADLTLLTTRVIKSSPKYVELLRSFDHLDKANTKASQTLLFDWFESIDKSESHIDPIIQYSLLVKTTRFALDDYNAQLASKLLSRLDLLIKLKFQHDLNRQFYYHLLRAENALNSNSTSMAESHLAILKESLYENDEYILQTFRVDYFDLLGHYYLTLNKLEKPNHQTYLKLALEHEYRALFYVQELPASMQKIRIHNNVAWVHRMLGQLQSSLRNYLIALNYLSKNPPQIVGMYNAKNIAEVYLALGDYLEASLFFKQAILLGKDQAQFWTIKNRCQLAVTQFHLNQLPTAKRNARQCIQSLYSLIEKDKSPIYINTLTEFLIEFEFFDNRQRRIDALIQLRPSHIIEPRILAKWYLFKASTTEDFNNQVYLYDQALLASQSSEDLGLRTKIAIEIAQLYRNSNSKKTLESIINALKVISDVNSKVSFGELGQHWLNDVNSFLSYAMEYLAEQNKLSELNTFQHILRVVITTASQQLTFSPREMANLNKLSQLSMDLIASPGHESRIALFTHRSQLALSSLFSNQDFTKGELMQFSPEFVPDTPTVKAEQKKENRNDLPVTAVASYIQGEKYYWALFTYKGVIELKRVGDVSRIDQQIRKVYTSLKHSRKIDWTVISRLLDKLIPSSFIERTDGHIFVQPAGLLHLFPFSLVNAFSTKNSLALTRYFPVEFKQQHHQDERNHAIVVFSDPTLDIEDTNDWRNGLPTLSWSGQEVNNIETALQKFTISHFVGASATRAALYNKQARNARVLHIAPHSFYSKEQPANIGFTLSHIKGSKEPGFVSFSEISQLKFNNDLVVVSGCESGLGLFNSYRGNFSIATAFLMAGAHQSVGTLWPISDKATAEFAKHFYRALASGMTASQALVMASRQLASNPRFKHPYYWAGYTLYSRELQQKTIY